MSPTLARPSLSLRIARHIPDAMAIFMAVIFLDSLRYKFTDHPKTQVIFGLLNGWATSLSLPGLFARTGLFSQYVIGSIELLASALLIVGILPRLRHLQAAGALAGLLVTPDRPRPWYLVWAAAAWSGVTIARTPAEADAAFYFDDVTHGRPPSPRAMRCLNFDCVDVSKSHVARVFEQVFGYPLAVDPRVETGVVVEKSEGNGVHDGQIVCCPRAAKPARVYQRLIDNIEGAHAVDLRTPFVDGRPVLTFIKRRPVARRFDNFNASVTLALPEDVFSRDEIDRLSAFARAMKLDWGGLDILRDAQDGRLYVVDVNKTDMPPLALPWIDKLRATARLGAAFRSLVTAPEALS